MARFCLFSGRILEVNGMWIEQKRGTEWTICSSEHRTVPHNASLDQLAYVSHSDAEYCENSYVRQADEVNSVDSLLSKVLLFKVYYFND